MCGRFACLLPPAAMARLFATTVPATDQAARYNVTPATDILAVRFNPRTRRRSLDSLLWGLIPNWARDPAIGRRLINARAETLAEKPAFRDAFRKRRCLIPADLFFEWDRRSKPPAPHAFAMADREAFAMAGLWENWQAPDGRWIRTCVIITTAANDLIRPMHDRMPVILPQPAHASWLGECPAAPSELAAMLTPVDPTRMTFWPVSHRIGDVRADAPDLIAPLPQDPE